MDGYWSLAQATNTRYANSGTLITLDDYKKGGYTLWAYDLSPSQCDEQFNDSYPITTLFSSAEVKLNNKTISYSSLNYAERSIIEILMKYTRNATNSWLATGLFEKDTAGQMNASSPNPGNDYIRFTWNKDKYCLMSNVENAAYMIVIEDMVLHMPKIYVSGSVKETLASGQIIFPIDRVV